MCELMKQKKKKIICLNLVNKHFFNFNMYKSTRFTSDHTSKNDHMEPQL